MKGLDNKYRKNLGEYIVMKRLLMRTISNICDEECDEEKNRPKAFAEDKDKLYMNLVDEFYDLNKKLSSINRRYRNIVHQLKRLQDEMPK